MSLFSRAHDILNAKANKALDAAEKPDEMLDLSYEQMLDQITKVRQGLVTIAASRKQIELQEQQLQHSVDHLQEQAKTALSLGKEDLAREALSRKAAAQAQIDGHGSRSTSSSPRRRRSSVNAAGAAAAGEHLPDPEGSAEGPVHRGLRVGLGERGRGRDLEHAG